MSDSWKPTTLAEASLINPKRQLVRGTIATHIAMDQIPQFQRTARKQSQREYTGSGTKYTNGDTLVARITPCLENGKTVFVDFLKTEEVGWGSTEFIVLAARHGVSNSLFLYYLARSKDFRDFAIQHMEGTSGRQRVPATALERYEFLLPPMVIQRRIAQILGKLDDKIELNRRMNETLEAMARRLFKSWFVDFDPVRAKASVRRQHPKLSNTEVSRRALPNMAPELAELFSDSFEDSTLGPIPKGWTSGFLPNAIEVNPSRSVVKGTTVAWLEMAKMPTSSARALSWEHREFKSGTKFINGDTLVARITPCLENGKTGFVDFLGDDEVGAGSTEYIVLRPKPPLPPIFAYLLARTDDFRQHLITNMTGTSGRQRAPADCLNTFPLVTPPKEIADRFAEVTGNLFSQMKTIDEESLGLTVTRDRLLPRLLSGDIEVVGNGESHEPT